MAAKCVMCVVCAFSVGRLCVFYELAVCVFAVCWPCVCCERAVSLSILLVVLVDNRGRARA